MVFPFIGHYIERCSSKGNVLPLTSIYTQYSDIVETSLCYDFPPECAEQQVDTLQDADIHFNKEVKERFSRHHLSGLRSLTFHLLDHRATDFEDWGASRPLM